MFFIIPAIVTAPPFKAPVTLSTDFGKDSIVEFLSPTLNTNGADNSVNLLNGNEIVLHVSFRISENVIVFNSFLNGSWGTEQRTTLKDKLAGPNSAITIIDAGDRYQILFNYKTIQTYVKRTDKPPTGLGFFKNSTPAGALFSDSIAATTFSGLNQLTSLGN